MRVSVSLRLTLKDLPLALIIIANIGIANRYLKKSTDSGFMPSLYSGRAKRGFMP